MAILLKGKTLCAICNRVIQENDDALMFPAFLKNTHRLYRYSDAALHRKCFDQSADKDEIEHLYSKYRAIWDGRPKDLKTVEEIEAWGKSAFADFE